MLEVFAGPADIYTKRLNEEPVHLLHAKKLLENAKGMGYLSPQLLKLKNCIFQYLVTGIRDFETAKKFLVDIAADFKAGHLLDPYEQALFVTNRGFLKGVWARYPEAIQDLKEGLALFESIEGSQNEMLKTIANLMLSSKKKAGESIISVSSACGVKKALESLKNILKKEGFTSMMDLVFACVLAGRIMFGAMILLLIASLMGRKSACLLLLMNTSANV